MLRTTLTPQAGGLVLPASVVRDRAGFEIAKLAARVRRMGSDDFTLGFPAWDFTDDGSILFLLDSLFWDQAYGRYEFQLTYDDHVVGSVDVDYKPYAPLRAGMPRPLQRKSLVFAAKPSGATDVFNNLEAFSAPIQAILERTDNTVALTEDDTALLAGTLPFAVELVLTDDVRTEIVKFYGLVDGAVIIERASAGTKPLRFPVGATLAFRWTSYNVSKAQ